MFVTWKQTSVMTVIFPITYNLGIFSFFFMRLVDAIYLAQECGTEINVYRSFPEQGIHITGVLTWHRIVILILEPDECYLLSHAISYRIVYFSTRHMDLLFDRPMG